VHDWWMQRMNPKMGWTEMLKEDKSRLDHGMSGYHKYVRAKQAQRSCPAAAHPNPCAAEHMRGRAHVRPSACAAERMCGRAHVRPSACPAERMCGRAHVRPSACAAERMCGRAHVRPSACAAERMCGRAHVRPSTCAAEHMRPRRSQGGFVGSPPDKPLACTLPPQDSTFDASANSSLVLAQVRQRFTLRHGRCACVYQRHACSSGGLFR
jgi:hypothetical protein